MTPADLLMKLTLASADIEFARSKCAQAELALRMGMGNPAREMALAMEAADRAAAHLGEICEKRSDDQG